MTDLNNLQHGAEAPADNDPMKFQRPNLQDDASNANLGEAAYNPSEPLPASRFKQDFNKPVGEFDGSDGGNAHYDRISGQLTSSHQR